MCALIKFARQSNHFHNNNNNNNNKISITKTMTIWYDVALIKFARQSNHFSLGGLSLIEAKSFSSL